MAVADSTNAPSATEPQLPSINGNFLRVADMPQLRQFLGMFLQDRHFQISTFLTSPVTASGNRGSAPIKPRDTPAGLGTYPGTTAPTVHGPKRPPCSQLLLPRCWAGCRQPPAVPCGVMAVPSTPAGNMGWENCCLGLSILPTALPGRAPHNETT